METKVVQISTFHICLDVWRLFLFTVQTWWSRFLFCLHMQTNKPWKSKLTTSKSIMGRSINVRDELYIWWSGKIFHYEILEFQFFDNILYGQMDFQPVFSVHCSLGQGGEASLDKSVENRFQSWFSIQLHFPISPPTPPPHPLRSVGNICCPHPAPPPNQSPLRTCGSKYLVEISVYNEFYFLPSPDQRWPERTVQHCPLHICTHTRARAHSDSHARQSWALPVFFHFSFFH